MGYCSNSQPLKKSFNLETAEVGLGLTPLVLFSGIALLLTHIQEIVHRWAIQLVNESHVSFTKAAYLSNIAREVYASLSEILDGFP